MRTRAVAPRRLLRRSFGAGHQAARPTPGVSGGARREDTGRRARRISAGEDAAEFLMAGARAVEVGTATFLDPRSPVRVAEELAEFLRREKVADVGDIVGTLKMGGG